MDNATDALKIAFAVLVFTIALTISISMFSQLNRVSGIVISSADNTKYYEYKITTDEQKSRIVGLENIIPTLYKYYKENYTVLFLRENGEPLNLYESQMNRKLWTDVNSDLKVIGKYYKNNSNNNPVCAFDVDEETIRHEPWVGTPSDYKENLDAFLYGGSFKYKSGGVDANGKDGYTYTKGFIERFSDKKFKETLGEYYYSLSTDVEGNTNELLKNRKKRVIIYQLQNKEN